MLYGRRDSRYRTFYYNNIIIRCCMEGESRYRTYHYNNIIIRCFMEGEIVDIELITIIISESSVVLSCRVGMCRITN